MARIIPVRAPFPFPIPTVSGTGTVTGGGGYTTVSGFTPDTDIQLLSTTGSLGQYTPIRILDAQSRLGTRTNAKAYQVFTYESGTAPDATYSRDTSNYVVDGSRVTTTTGGIALPPNNTGMLATQNLGTPGVVAGPECFWTGSGAQKTMAITEEYIGWDMIGDANVTNCKIFRWSNFAGNHSFYNGIGTTGGGSPGSNVTSVEATGPDTLIWIQTGEYPRDRQQNWNSWLELLTESSGNGVANASHLSYFNGVLWIDKSKPSYTGFISRDASFPTLYDEISLGYQCSNSGGISATRTVGQAFALFDTEHGGIVFWSTESTINTTVWSAGSDTAVRAFCIPNGCAAGQADQFNRLGVHSALNGMYLWILKNDRTFLRLGRKDP